MSNSSTPPYWLCVIAPLGTVVGVLAVRAIGGATTFERWMMSERGVIELATVALLIPAVVFGFTAARREAGLARIWLACLALGCVYFAGEEISWGQHLFGWSTPEGLRALNDQQETNLHNMSSWLDQKPRLLLELWVLGLTVAGFSQRFRGWWGRWTFLWGGRRLAIPGLLALLVRLPERFASWFDLTLPFLLDFRLAELQELMFGWALLLYLWVKVGSRGGGPVNSE